MVNQPTDTICEAVHGSMGHENTPVVQVTCTNEKLNTNRYVLIPGTNRIEIVQVYSAKSI